MSNLIIAYLLVLCGGLTRNKYVHQFLILFLAYLFSTRNENVPDTDNYMFHYENALVELMDVTGDIGMVALNYLFNNILDLPFSVFLFVLTFFLMEICYYATKRIVLSQHIGIVFLLFMSFYGFFYFGIIIRNGVALTLCYLALSFLIRSEKWGKLKFVGVMSLALLFHKSSILLFPLLFLVNMKMTYNRAVIWFLLSLLMIGLGSVSMVSSSLKLIEGVDSYSYDRYSSYTEDSTTKLYTATFIMDFFITIVSICGQRIVKNDVRQMYEFVLKVILLGFSMYCLLWQLPGISRIAGMYFFMSSLVFYIFIYWSKYKVSNALKNSLTLIVSLSYFISLVIIQKYILYY